MQGATDRRMFVRTAVKLPVKVAPDFIGETVDLSETGLNFSTDKSLKSVKSRLTMEFPGKESITTEFQVVWNRPLGKDRFQFGARFSALDRKDLFQIKDLIFDTFAKKALALIQDNNKDLKIKVDDFFNKDIRKYHEDLFTLVGEIEKEELEPEEIEKKLTILTNELLLEGNALEKMVDNNIHMKKIKQIFRESISCWCYKSPILKMAYDKPRGYPGDYKLSEIIYDKKPLAENKSLGFYWDNYFLNNAYTKAVRTRKNRMKNILQDFIENTELTTIRLLNIACGPTREIRELLFDPILASRKNVIFTGLDNDEEALKFSQSKLNNLPPNIKVRFLNENVLNISRDNKYYDMIGKQDIIYILGLTEYLPDRIFRKLIHFLSQLLNDKGMLVITYKDESITFPSLPPDWLCDWAFIKRAKDDLVNTAKELGSDKFSLNIEREGSGSIFFLKLIKT